MAKSPAEQLADIMSAALDKVIKENPNLFTVNVTNQESGGSGDGGGSSIDPLSLILGMGLFASIADPAAGGILEAVKTGVGKGGSSSEAFGIGWLGGSLALEALAPYWRYVTHAVESEAQSQIFDPATAADLAARKIITDDFGKSEASGGGFDGSHWDSFADAALNRPTWDVALRLWNRGEIGENDVNVALQYGGIPEEWWPWLKSLQREILTPPDLALAVLRQTITLDDGVAGAAKWGLNADDFNTVLMNTGEPLSPQELNMALRRGFITEDRYSQGIRESRIRDDWIPTALALRYFPMSVAQAANAVVRGYMDASQGADIAQQNGLEPDHWQYVLEGNGRPPSHEQLASLWLRGLISEAEFAQGIRESDIKDKYIQDVMDLRVKFLPLFEARALLNAGEITGQTFADQLLPQGYQKEVIDEILKGVGTGTKVKAKHLTEAEYTELYLDGLLSRTQAHDGIVTLGYTTQDATELLDLADAKQKQKIVNELVSNIRAQFNRFKLTDDEAKDKLNLVGLPVAEADKLVSMWGIVRPEGTRTLTEAQILKAAKLKAITPEDAINRLRGLGLDETDANLLFMISG